MEKREFLSVRFFSIPRAPNVALEELFGSRPHGRQKTEEHARRMKLGCVSYRTCDTLFLCQRPRNLCKRKDSRGIVPLPKQHVAFQNY